MFIRAAEEKDRLAIGRVYCETWQSAYRGLIPEAFLLTLTAERCAPPRVPIDRAFVCENEGKVVGIVDFGASREGNDSSCGEIHSLYVLPAFWRQGVGKALFLAAKERLHQRGYRSIMLWTLADNLHANLFYRKMGMTRGDCRIISIGERNLREVQYFLSLSVCD